MAKTAKKKRRVGRPLFVPTDQQRQQVQMLIGMGLREDEVCKVIFHPRTLRPISPHTLRRAFRADIDRGIPIVKAQIMQATFRKAMGNGPQSGTLLIWAAKNILKWSDRQIQEVVGKDGGPVEHRHTRAELDAEKLAGLTDEQLASVYADAVSPPAATQRKSNGTKH